VSTQGVGDRFPGRTRVPKIARFGRPNALTIGFLPAGITGERIKSFPVISITCRIHPATVACRRLPAEGGQPHPPPIPLSLPPRDGGRRQVPIPGHAGGAPFPPFLNFEIDGGFESLRHNAAAIEFTSEGMLRGCSPKGCTCTRRVRGTGFEPRRDVPGCGLATLGHSGTATRLVQIRSNSLPRSRGLTRSLRGTGFELPSFRSASLHSTTTFAVAFGDCSPKEDVRARSLRSHRALRLPGIAIGKPIAHFSHFASLVTTFEGRKRPSHRRTPTGQCHRCRICVGRNVAWVQSQGMHLHSESAWDRI